MSAAYPAVAADGLTKRYGSTVAVDGLDLEIPPGTVYGFLGPNGAGKTTTMRLLTTLTEPSSGTARVCGVPVSDREAVVERFGYLPEVPPVYDELTAREHLRYVADLRGLGDADDRIERHLERFGLEAAADDRIGTYSKGMRQKTALIGTVLHDPEVVFLDEPTSGLDPRAARAVRQLVADLAADETTVFLSTHVLPVVEELADTVGVLSGGRLLAEDAPEALRDRAEGGDGSLEAAFLDITDGWN